MLDRMSSHFRPRVTGLCLMFSGVFVLRSNGIIVRTLLKHKMKIEKGQKAALGENIEKNTESTLC